MEKNKITIFLEGKFLRATVDYPDGTRSLRELEVVPEGLPLEAIEDFFVETKWEAKFRSANYIPQLGTIVDNTRPAPRYEAETTKIAETCLIRHPGLYHTDFKVVFNTYKLAPGMFLCPVGNPLQQIVIKSYGVACPEGYEFLAMYAHQDKNAYLHPVFLEKDVPWRITLSAEEADYPPGMYMNWHAPLSKIRE